MPPVPIVLLTPAANLPPVSTILAAKLQPVANCRRSPRIFEKIRNGRNGILRCLGETDSGKKTRSRKSCDTVPLSPIHIYKYPLKYTYIDITGNNILCLVLYALNASGRPLYLYQRRSKDCSEATITTI
jgi:hypothetical protein